MKTHSLIALVFIAIFFQTAKAASSCDFSFINGYYHVMVAGESAYGSKSFKYAYEELLTLTSEGICKKPISSDCNIQFDKNKQSYTIIRGEKLFSHGTSSLENIISDLEELQKTRICTLIQPEKCEVAYSNDYYHLKRNGNTFSYRTKGISSIKELMTLAKEKYLCD